MTTVHTLKCWAPYFDAIADGLKTFEMRRNDRDYRVGDTLELVRCYEDPPHDPTPDGSSLRFRVTYMTMFGCKDGFVCMAIQRNSWSDVEAAERDLKEAIESDEAGIEAVLDAAFHVIKHYQRATGRKETT